MTSVSPVWSLVGVLAVLTAFTGCDEPRPPSCADLEPYRGTPIGEVGVYAEDGSPWLEGDEVSLDLGGQGGFMVQPVLSLDSSVVGIGVPDQFCARVEIDNVDPTGGDRFVGFETLTLELPFRRNDVTGRYDTDVIFNQLRWAPLPPGTAYRMNVVVRTEETAAFATRNMRFR